MGAVVVVPSKDAWPGANPWNDVSAADRMREENVSVVVFLSGAAQFTVGDGTSERLTSFPPAEVVTLLGPWLNNSQDDYANTGGDSACPLPDRFLSTGLSAPAPCACDDTLRVLNCRASSRGR